MIGQKYGRLKVIGEAPRQPRKGGTKGSPRVFVECDCGVIKDVIIYHLISGAIISCGCYKREKASTHKLSKTREYKSWYSMVNRCLGKRDKDLVNYGNVSVCDEWKNDFLKFLEDMGPCPDNYEIDRIDVNGNYCKENCRWANGSEQSYNRGMLSTNKSGKTGVSFDKEAGKWRAIIYKDRVKIDGGSFVDKEDAIRARLDLELKYYGYTKK